ncbi:MAG: hypothetical protein JO160_07565, partial [Candidatus Eremiobacteraeota bacterium]|nr:hypothetical protein [Candidatus Eremiobacteraeota bacterium]
MSASLRRFAALACAGAVCACSGYAGRALLPQSEALQNPPMQRPAVREAIPFVPPVDIGRRAPGDRVSAVVLLRYNRQAELDELTTALTRTPNARYLTRAEFVARFSPTQEQQQRVADALRAGGFRVDQTFPNRTTMDVSAPSAAFERFFGTEIHDFAQGRYGRRYANVTPIRIPRELAGLVAAVDARSVVTMHSDLLIAQEPAVTQSDLKNLALPAIVAPRERLGTDAVPEAAGNVVRNPGFETGHLRPWTTCDSSGTHNKASIQKVHPHSGRFDAYAGTYANQPEPNGLTSVCQTVTIPNGAALSAWVWGISNDRSHSVHQFGAIYDATTGKPIKTVFITNRNATAWKEYRADLSAYAGRNVYLAFGVIGSSAHRSKTIGQLVDDVSLSGFTGTPTPPPQQTLPCPAAAAPTPTPAFASNDGWGPASVQDGFCMPVNYGYDGTGQTAAIVIDKEVNPTDLSDYLSAWNITRSGSLSYVLVDHAAAANDNEGEASLDIETIAGLAPGANIIVYVTGDLSDQHIADAYQAALNDTHHPAVVNSSFGGCESITSSGTFDQTTNTLAQQGAAVGMTFSASSGDQGADCFNGNQHHFPFGVQGPASGTYFVGVGGNQSTVPYVPSSGADVCSSGTAVPATINNPVEWSDCIGAGGGGISQEW